MDGVVSAVEDGRKEKVGKIMRIMLKSIVEGYDFDQSESTAKKVLSATIISDDTRDKSLKETQSWSTNCVLRLFYILKKSESDIERQSVESYDNVAKFTEKIGHLLPEFTTAVFGPLPHECSTKILPNGYLIFVNPQKIEAPTPTVIDHTDADEESKEQAASLTKG